MTSAPSPRSAARQPLREWLQVRVAEGMRLFAAAALVIMAADAAITAASAGGPPVDGASARRVIAAMGALQARRVELVNGAIIGSRSPVTKLDRAASCLAMFERLLSAVALRRSQWAF